MDCKAYFQIVADTPVVKNCGKWDIFLKYFKKTLRKIRTNHLIFLVHL